jgi:GNAT superfamily N-acetyltransferase
VSGASIERLDPDGYVAAIPGLAALTVDAVDGGAGVNFLAGVTTDEAETWWRERIGLVAEGSVTPIVAVAADGRIVGSTLLIRSRNANSPHRAEIAKVIVHRTARRQGLGRALMSAAEDLAKSEGRWLLLLDTESGGAADSLYRSMGWHEFGVVPDHALRTDGVLSQTTFFWKDLR